MILTKEQFETQWAENTLTTTDWFDTTWALFKELEEAMKPKTCDTFDKGASSTNYPPKTIFAFGNYYTLKDTQC